MILTMYIVVIDVFVIEVGSLTVHIKCLKVATGNMTLPNGLVGHMLIWLKKPVKNLLVLL